MVAVYIVGRSLPNRQRLQRHMVPPNISSPLMGGRW